MSENDKKPGIRIIPPIVYLIGLVIGFGFERLWPIIEMRSVLTIIIGIILILLSVLLIVPSILKFRIAATPFDIRKPATALVTDGPYRYSRNPGYLALTLLYIGLALIIGSIWVVIMLAPVLVVIHYGVIKREERHLLDQFGEEYIHYKKKVRRWF